MKTRDLFWFSFGALKNRKSRVFITTLGITIGIAAIIALSSLGQGFEQQMATELKSALQTNTLYVVPKNDGKTKPITFDVADTTKFTAIQYVDDAMPMIFRSVNVEFSNQSFTPVLIGVDPVKMTQFIPKFKTLQGTVTNETGTTLIGYDLAFPYGNSTQQFQLQTNLTFSWLEANQTEYITKNASRAVSGVFKKSGTSSVSISGSDDNSIFLPLQDALNMYNTTKVEVYLVRLVNDDNATITYVIEKIKELFQNRVDVISPQSIIESIHQQLAQINIFLGIIAGISLIVAGVGILNIMLISMLERTREIGILKALGTSDRAILSIFLIESAFIGVLGSILGIIAGYGGALAAGTTFGAFLSGDAAFKMVPVLTPQLILMAFFFGVCTSVLFGLYPAWRASHLVPVDALHHE